MRGVRGQLAGETRHPAHRVSLRVRLALWVVTIFVIIQGVTAAIFWLYQYSATVRVFDDRLLERARAMAMQVAPLLPMVEPAELEDIARGELAFVPVSRFIVDVFDEQGGSVVQGHPAVLAPNMVAKLLPKPFTLPIFARIEVPTMPGDPRAAKVPLRAVLLPIVGPDQNQYTFLIGTSDDVIRAQFALIGQVLLLAALVGAVAAAISGWFIGGIAVAPFDRLRKLAQQLTPESLGRELTMESSNAEVARLTEELNQARRRLQRGFASQERFISNVSHELKTPISTLLIEAQTIDREKLSPAALDFVRSVEDETTRLGQLVDSFLTLTRVRDGSDVRQPRPCGANDLVMESVDHCRAFASQHHVRLQPRLLASEETVDTQVNGDPILLRTMLDNLVLNAVRFSPAGNTVEVNLFRSDSMVSIAVRDFGPGIPPERLATIFDRFSQAQEEQRRGRGHGLGLAIAQGIAELHGGSVSAENHPEVGCVFTARLPVLNGEGGTGDR